MTTPSFQKLASETASTKRPPALSANKIGAAVTYLTGVSIVPLVPADKEIEIRYNLNSSRRKFVTYFEGTLDILEKDTLVVGGIEYPIVAVAPYNSTLIFREVIVEEVKVL